MKTLRTINDLNTALSTFSKLIIYGTGWGGKTIGRFLKSNNIPISAFAVTISDQYEEIEGVPVYGIEEILKIFHSDEIMIVLAVTKANQYAIEKELEQRKVCSYLVLSDILLYKIAAENGKLAAEEAELKKSCKRMEKRIGYLTPGYLDSDYAEKRLIIDKIEGFSYMAIPKETVEFHGTDRDYENHSDTYHQIIEACYSPDRYIPEVGLLHTFNTVCDTDKPWCASFETALPRIACETKQEKEFYLQLVEYMKKDNCRALFALCKNAYEIQKESLASASIPQGDIELLMEKTKVLHPPQEILISEIEFEKKHNTKKIHFIFVGKAFFIKGGRELVETLSEFEGKYDFDFTLISSLQYDDYFTKTSYKEMMRCRDLILDKKWIDYYESLPNDEVLKKCRKAAVGLLPSVAETYGYAVLEMQAAGCPVVTTNIRAFPEINNEECGWMCRLPIDKLRFCTEENAEIWSAILRDELRKCILDIFEHPKKIKEKGRRAMERIREKHNPHKYQKILHQSLNIP